MEQGYFVSFAFSIHFSVAIMYTVSVPGHLTCLLISTSNIKMEMKTPPF